MLSCVYNLHCTHMILYGNDIGWISNSVVVIEKKEPTAKWSLIKYLYFDVDPGDTDIGHTYCIFNKYLYLINEITPDRIIYECPRRFRNDELFAKLSWIEACLFLAAKSKNIPVIANTALYVKKKITGNGKATKNGIEYALKNREDIEGLDKLYNEPKYKRVHLLDSLAIALSGI